MAPGSKGDSMVRFRTLAALSATTGAAVLAAMSTAAAQTADVIQAAAAPAPSVATIPHGFNRCPQTADQYAELMKQLSSTAARVRPLADQDPMYEPDAAFYAAELAATKKCAPTVAI